MSSQIVPTTIVEKGAASVVNILLFACIALPLKEYLNIFSCFFLFLVFQMLFLLRSDKRDLGMLIVGSYYERAYPWYQRLLYIFLYTLSVITIFFPLIFALNILIQVLCITVTGTTLHGYLAGDIRTMVPKR